MKKRLSALILLICCLAVSLFAKNAYWKPNISFIPTSPVAGDTIHFKAIINLEGDIASCQSNYMQNIRVVAKVDEEIIYNEVLYYFCPGVDYTMTADWVAKGGSHKIVFTLEATDSLTPDSNPNDNMVQKNFSVYQPPLRTDGTPQPPQDTTNATLNTTPQNIHTSTPQMDMKYAPCTEYQNERTDLAVQSLVVYPKSGNNWEFSAAVQNMGRRCIRILYYELKNMNHTLISSHVGNNSTFFLPAGGFITIKAVFAKPDSGFLFYSCENHNCANFELTIDPMHMIPDPNRYNNGKTVNVYLN
jgi:hypothetical protein